MKKRDLVKSTAAGGAMVLVLASFAWACTNQARIITLNSISGAPSAVLAISGNRVPASSSVEVRWDALNGPKIGSAIADQAGNFATQVSVPEVKPGIYTIVASAGEFAVARTAFEVTAPAAAASSPSQVRQPASNDLWNGFAQARGASATDVGVASHAANRTGMTAGLGLLGASLAGACFAATFVLSSRRRRTAVNGGFDKGGSPMG